MSRTSGVRALAVGSLLVVSLGAAQVRAAEIALIPASRDNTLYEFAGPARSNGAGPTVFAGRVDQDEDSIRRGVMAFDVAGQLPPGSRVLRAALVLHVDRTGPNPGGVILHRLLANFGEGTSSAAGGRGAPAAPGDATWIHTFFDTDFWGAPGGDFLPQKSAVGRELRSGYVLFGPTVRLRKDVQAWLDRPDQAFGWLLAGDESELGTVVVYGSRESPDDTKRPTLIVQYQVRGQGRTRLEQFQGQDEATRFDTLLRSFITEAAAPHARPAPIH